MDTPREQEKRFQKILCNSDVIIAPWLRNLPKTFSWILGKVVPSSYLWRKQEVMDGFSHGIY